MTTTRKLRVVPLSLTPSCVTRKKTPRKLPARTPGGEKHGSRPQDFTRPLFPRGSSTVSLDGLSERRTTRSLNHSHTSQHLRHLVLLFLISQTNINLSEQFAENLLENAQTFALLKRRQHLKNNTYTS